MKVKFRPVSKDAEISIAPPLPARKYLPQWYLDIPPFSGGKIAPTDSGRANSTVRICMPFSDSLSSGYIQETWQDIYVEYLGESNGVDNLKIHQPDRIKMIGIRDGYSIPIQNEYYKNELVFHPPWIPELPKGWSMLYLSPLNRPDLPFQIASGIVDSDLFSSAEKNSNMPFYIKKGFTGIIPKGTPMYQMIPIKRKKWTSEVLEFDYEHNLKINSSISQHMWGGYKKLYHNKKDYK